LVSLDSQVQQASQDLRDYLAQQAVLGQQVMKVNRVSRDGLVYLEQLDRLARKVTKVTKVELVMLVQWGSRAHKGSVVRLVHKDLQAILVQLALEVCE